MSDADRDSTAWRRTPSAYLDTRPAQGAAARPHSLYVAMPDGCRLAVDVYLPPHTPSRVPAILIFTPYYRRFALTADAMPGAEASPGVARWRELCGMSRDLLEADPALQREIILRAEQAVYGDSGLHAFEAAEPSPLRALARRHAFVSSPTCRIRPCLYLFYFSSQPECCGASAVARR